jgi:hypothetical protein
MSGRKAILSFQGLDAEALDDFMPDLNEQSDLT